MAEMEARIDKLIREQQLLMDDVQRLQLQNKQLKQQVTERENGGEQVAAVKVESVESVKSEKQQWVEGEEQSSQLQVSEHVSQDHVSACADSAVECEVEEASVSDWSDVVSESRDVYHESAVLGAPQWQTTRNFTPHHSPLFLLTPLTTLYLCLHSTLLLLSTAPTLCLWIAQHHSTTPSSTPMTSHSSPTTTTSRTTVGCNSSPESADSSRSVLDMEGGECAVVSSSSSLVDLSTPVSLLCRPALMCG